MSLASTLRRAAAPAALAVMTAFAAANDAHADVAFGCRKPADVPALQEQVLKGEGMVPVAARFTARSGDVSSSGFVQETIMMNEGSKTGLKWTKYPDGGVCINTKYRDMELFDNSSFDEHALIALSGKKATQVPVNQAITKASFQASVNPMFRARASTPTNVAMNLPTDYYEFMLGNAATQKGVVIASNLDGEPMASFTKDIPNPTEAPVKFGAVYSEKGKDILSRKVANSGPSIVALSR